MNTAIPGSRRGLRQVAGGLPSSIEDCTRFGCSVLPTLDDMGQCPFGVIGLSYRTASLELRGRTSFTGERAEGLLQKLREHGVREAIVLSTCNRTEIYFAHRDADLVIGLFAAASGVNPEALRPHLYLKKSLCAACHILRVVSGLDSAVLGETEIVAQVKLAWRMAETFGSCGPGLGHLMQRSMEVGKRVRTQTDLGRGMTSIATLAVRRAKEHLKSLNGKHVVLVGAGQIAERVAKELARHELGSFRILNRSSEKAARLATLYGGQAGGLDQLGEAIATADVAVVAIASSQPVIGDAMVSDRRGPLLLVDLGVPSGVFFSETHPDVEVLNLDRLTLASSQNLERRMSAVPIALEVLDEELVRLRDDLTVRAAAPTIKALVNQAEAIRQTNLDWALERLTGLTDKERKVVEDLSNRIIKGMLQAPIEGLKHELAADNHREVISKLFQLQEIEHEPIAS